MKTLNTIKKQKTTVFSKIALSSLALFALAGCSTSGTTEAILDEANQTIDRINDELSDTRETYLGEGSQFKRVVANISADAKNGTVTVDDKTYEFDGNTISDGKYIVSTDLDAVIANQLENDETGWKTFAYTFAKDVDLSDPESIKTEGGFLIVGKATEEMRMPTTNATYKGGVVADNFDKSGTLVSTFDAVAKFGDETPTLDVNFSMSATDKEDGSSSRLTGTMTGAEIKGAAFRGTTVFTGVANGEITTVGGFFEPGAQEIAGGGQGTVKSTKDNDIKAGYYFVGIKD